MPSQLEVSFARPEDLPSGSPAALATLFPKANSLPNSLGSPLALEAFDFQLPRERLADGPSGKRGEARLLVLDRRTGCVDHRQFRNILEYLRGKTVYVNNSKLLGRWVSLVRDRMSEDKAFLIEQVAPRQWLAFLSLPPMELDRHSWACNGVPVSLRRAEKKDQWALTFEQDLDLEKVGHYLLPPSKGSLARELREEDLAEPLYAKVPGSFAAPTAGIHFTREMLAELRPRDLWLHTAPGGFYRVREEELGDARTESEVYEIPEPPLGKAVAVGTTVVKALESWALTGERKGVSDLFIRPPFEFRVVEMLLTCLHQPRESLLILTCAFGGTEAVMKAYHEAVREGYRFGYCDDLMLVV